QHDLLRLELDGVDELLEDVVELRPAVALVGRRCVTVAVLATGRVVEFDLGSALWGTDDRVERRLLTKVDARLVLAKHTSARDARLDELGHAVRRALVASRRDDAETVRVDEGLVVAAVAATSVGRVDLAHRDDRVLHLAVNLIT